MKYYILDKVLLLLVSIIIIIYLAVICGGFVPFVIVIAIITSISTLDLCQDVLKVVIDKKDGYVLQQCRYIGCLRIQKNDVLANYGYCKLCFDVNGEDLVLTAPLPCYVWDIPQSFYPPKEKDITVRYYKRSKIMISWEQIE